LAIGRAGKTKWNDVAEIFARLPVEVVAVADLKLGTHKPISTDRTFSGNQAIRRTGTTIIRVAIVTSFSVRTNDAIAANRAGARTAAVRVAVATLCIAVIITKLGLGAQHAVSAD
jgi:hypothetical protein